MQHNFTGSSTCAPKRKLHPQDWSSLPGRIGNVAFEVRPDSAAAENASTSAPLIVSTTLKCVPAHSRDLISRRLHSPLCLPLLCVRGFVCVCVCVCVCVGGGCIWVLCVPLLSMRTHLCVYCAYPSVYHHLVRSDMTPSVSV